MAKTVLVNWNGFVHLIFEPRDLWIGVYWDRGTECYYQTLSIYICIVPMLPVAFYFRWIGTDGNPTTNSPTKE